VQRKSGSKLDRRGPSRAFQRRLIAKNAKASFSRGAALLPLHPASSLRFIVCRPPEASVKRHSHRATERTEIERRSDRSGTRSSPENASGSGPRLRLRGTRKSPYLPLRCFEGRMRILRRKRRVSTCICLRTIIRRAIRRCLSGIEIESRGRIYSLVR